MKNRSFFLFLLFLFIVFKASSQDFQITISKLDFYGNQLVIDYYIDSKTPGRFKISIEIKSQNGESITPKSLTGDIGDNIKSGVNKQIIWHLENDSIYLDEDISVEIRGQKLIKSHSKGSLILMSTVFPGLGQTKITGKPWWIAGVATYGTLAAGLVYNKKSGDDHESYLDATGTPRDEYYNKSVKEYNTSMVLITTAASIWAANIIWVAVMPDRNKALKHAKVYFSPAAIPYKGAMVSLRVDF